MRPITFISERDESCTFCGENRVTDDIHGFVTSSTTTPCEKDKFLPFILMSGKTPTSLDEVSPKEKRSQYTIIY